MAVRRGRPVAKKVPVKRAPASRQAKPTPNRGRQKTELTDYATKAPTEYHKAFAKWIVEEIGYKPSNRKDFLMGVSIATAARPKFMESDFLAEWREKSGEAKRGPKPTTRSKAKAKPVEDDDDDFEDVDEDDDDDDFEDESEEDDDDFEDEDEDSEDDEDSEEDDEDDDDEEEEEEEEEERPAKSVKRGRPTVANSRARKAAPASKAPAKGRSKVKAGSDDGDEFLF